MALHHEKRMKKGTGRKSVALTVSLILLLTVIVGGTIAFIVDVTGTVTNIFSLAEIPNEIVENFDGETKKNVAIQNASTQDEDAYIRAAIIVTWAEVKQDETTGAWVATGNVHSTVPVLGEDYTLTLSTDVTVTYPVNSENAKGESVTIQSDPDGTWVRGKDGYYYFTKPVAKGEYTDVLISECKPSYVEVDNGDGIKTTLTTTPNQPEGNYVLSVEIVSQSIQADGVDKDGNHPVVLAWGPYVQKVNDDRSLDILEPNEVVTE